MSRARLIRVFFVVFSIALFAPTSQAQVANVDDTTSTPIAGAGHDYIHLLSETVSPANGSVSLRIQVPMPKGRGITIPFSFGYDSGSVHHLNPGLFPGLGSVAWASNTDAFAQGGWSNSLPTLRSDSWEQDVAVISGINDGQPIYTIYPCYYASNYTFRDVSGAVHALNLGSLSWNGGNPPPSGCPLGGPSSTGGDGQFGGALTSNSQGMVLPNPATVYDEAGTIYSYSSYRGTCPLAGCFGSPDYIEDRNGNRAIFTQNTVTDTLGRTLIFETGLGASGTTQPVTISGGLTYQFTWKSASATFSVPSTWAGQSSEPSQFDQCSPIPQANDTSTVVSQIAMPNGQQFHFYYGTDNPNPAFQNPYGMLSEIDYPSGAWVRYTWKLSDTMNELAVFPGMVVHAASECGASPTVGCPWPVPDGCTYQYKTPVVASRTVGLSGSTNPILTQTFTYSTTWAAPANGNVGGISWTQKTTNVTTTDNVTGKSTLTSYQYSPVSLPISPFSNTTIAQQAPVESTIKYYDWGNTTTPLRTVNKTWADIVHLKSQQTILENGSSSQTVYSYQADPSGHFEQLTEVDDYDFGATTPTRKTLTTYQAFSGTPGILSDSPCKVVTQDGSGNAFAETDYLYDGGTSVCGAAGTPSVAAVTNLVANTHDETLFAPGASTSRGNPTKIIQKCLQSCLDSTSTHTYDETGQLLTRVDACGNTACSDMIGTNHTTTYSYADNYDSPPSGNTNAYLTQITDPLGHTSKFKYAYSDGQLISTTDQNNQTTSYLYNDSLRRLTETDLPDGGKTTLSYNDAPPSPSVTTSRLMNTSNQYVTSTATMDGLGHVIKTLLTSDPDCASGDRTDTTYDGLGRVYTVSNPYCTASDPTYGLTTYAYDALGRTTQVTNPDNSTVLSTYTGRATQVQDEGNGNGTQRVTRISQTDALGRLMSVCEVSSSSLIGQNGSATSCGQDIAGTGFSTTYLYDVLGNLLQVSQGTMTSRSFVYDSLSRLTSSTNPESNMQSVPPYTLVPTTYTYDANSNLQTKTAPAPNQTGTSSVTTTYAYDVLNRLTQRSYNDGVTPTAQFIYDSSPHYSPTNAVGRLVETYVPFPPTGTPTKLSPV